MSSNFFGEISNFGDDGVSEFLGECSLLLIRNPSVGIQILMVRDYC